MFAAVIWFLLMHSLFYKDRILGSASDPIYESAKRGHYDDAVQKALAQIRDQRRDYFQYNEVVMIYLLRSYKDEPHREEWAQQAASYIDKMASLASDNPLNLVNAAHDYERVGDLSKNGCASYTKAITLSQAAIPLLQAETVAVKDWKVPAEPIRQENDSLLQRLSEKTHSSCAATHGQVSPSGLR